MIRIPKNVVIYLYKGQWKLQDFYYNTSINLIADLDPIWLPTTKVTQMLWYICNYSG